MSAPSCSLQCMCKGPHQWLFRCDILQEFRCRELSGDDYMVSDDRLLYKKSNNCYPNTNTSYNIVLIFILVLF